jgi:acyl dehydratase
MPTRWFEDVPLGRVLEYGSYTVTEEEIVEFAREFDPQPFHIDREAAKQSPYGGLIASGWHTCALWMKMSVPVMIGENNKAAVGSPGVLELRWVKPVRPGDTLRVRSTVVEKVDLKSRPDRGIIRSRNEVFNQKDELVMSMIGQALTLKRPAAAMEEAG